MRRTLILALTLLVGLPAHAQKSAEVAAQNVQCAMTICFENYADHPAINSRLTRAGFVHELEIRADGQVLSWYAAPAGTARALVIGQQGQTECQISTNAFGVKQAPPVARAVISKLYTGKIADGAPAGQNVLPGTPQAQQGGCAGFHVFAPRRLIWVAAERAGNDGTCLSDSTTQIVLRI
ncbi:hypothetical protein [Actibacterium sp. 188UL27-1]|uniref:hypothetical protein n=1 Tax=Actibacterium sp. 188UL27-1 TaxID=2786961 RepID=UPI0019594015|nr:hypothetical protein [Actibacterium sp. 188UL27-1]MBM7068361.1 hypothetical protein [Actibacterium sp. 188UL27-1]